MNTGPDSEVESWPTGRLLSVAARLVESRWAILLDELGSLAESFNQMAEKVQASQQTLEDTVTRRTAELSQALTRLEEAQAAKYDLVCRKLALQPGQQRRVGGKAQHREDVGGNENNGDSEITSEFPMTADAFNVTEAGGSLIFYTKLSLEETMQFYRNEYASKGYTEREILTVVSDGTFSMVFDGDPSGQAVVIQSVELGDGSVVVEGMSGVEGADRGRKAN